MHRPLLVVKTEQQRAECRAVARPAPSDDDAVRGSLVLDLHPESLARHVGPSPRLGDDAVESRALELFEPLLRLLRVPRVWRQEDRPLDSFQELLEPLASFAQRLLAEIHVAL